MRAIAGDLVITLRGVKINRPRLLAASLVVAVVVSLGGGYVWSRTVADSSDGVDAVLEDPIGPSPLHPEGAGHHGIEAIAAFWAFSASSE